MINSFVKAILKIFDLAKVLNDDKLLNNDKEFLIV